MEFGLSRSRSYELIDQARVIRALQAATGMSGIPDISAYAAGDVKRQLDEVIAAVRARIAGVPRENVPRVVSDVVNEIRGRLPGPTTDPPASVAPGCTDEAPAMTDLSRLYEAVDCLAHMPPVTATLTSVPPAQRHRLDRLACALRWLADFTDAWQGVVRPSVSGPMLTDSRAARRGT